MTVNEALREADEILDAAGVDGPRLTAELIMAHVLDTGRPGVLAGLLEPLDAHREEEFFRLVTWRAKRMPLQHITGSVEFCGREFKVTPDTLIPRPETELLVEEGLVAVEDLPDPVAADIGTGSGCIAVSLAAANPGLKVYAVEQSAAALMVAIENSRLHEVSGQVMALQGSLFKPLDAMGLSGSLDLVVSNPPYIPSGDIGGLQPEVQREPMDALNGGPDGLDVIGKIIRDAPGFMKPGAVLLVEIGAGQSEAVRAMVDASPGLQFSRYVPDFSGIERVLVAKRV